MSTDQMLSSWVKENCLPGARWRWHPPAGQSAVIMVIHGWRAVRDGKYSVEISHFYLEDTSGAEIDSQPHGVPLPKWFVEAFTQMPGYQTLYDFYVEGFWQYAQQGKVRRDFRSWEALTI